MAKHWIKLWIDFLEDDKLGPLPEYIQLRFIKLCLLAGDIDESGQLPPVERIAWRLRLDEIKVRETLVALREVGVVEETPTCWVIVNYSKRQAPFTSTERSQMLRMKRERNEGATISLQSDSASVSSSDSDSLKPREDSLKAKNVFAVYESEIGLLTPMIADSIQDELNDSPEDWIVAAIHEAARVNKRSWAYGQAILKRWKVEGFQSRKSGSNGSKPHGSSSTLPSAFEAWENLCSAWEGERSVAVEVEGGTAIDHVHYTWLHSEVERIGRMLGWPSRFPNPQNLGTDRAHFIKAWDSEAKDG